MRQPCFCYFFLLTLRLVGFAGAFGALAGFLGLALAADFMGGFLPVGLGGGAVGLPSRGGIARIRHLGQEPMRSSRWAFSSASRTR